MYGYGIFHIEKPHLHILIFFFSVFLPEHWCKAILFFLLFSSIWDKLKIFLFPSKSMLHCLLRHISSLFSYMPMETSSIKGSDFKIILNNNLQKHYCSNTQQQCIHWYTYTRYKYIYIWYISISLLGTKSHIKILPVSAVSLVYRIVVFDNKICSPWLGDNDSLHTMSWPTLSYVYYYNVLLLIRMYIFVHGYMRVTVSAQWLILWVNCNHDCTSCGN